jgi:hypothetical protein
MKKSSKLKLRSRPRLNLKFEDVRKMLKKYDFYCGYTPDRGDLPSLLAISSYCNTGGKGLEDIYLLSRNDRVVYDLITNLCWQREDSKSQMTFEQSKDYIKKINDQCYAGFKDWRLPTLEEAMSLVKPSVNKRNLHIFFYFVQNYREMWTTDKIKGNTNVWPLTRDKNKNHWIVNIRFGFCELADEAHERSVRAVRAGTRKSDQERNQQSFGSTEKDSDEICDYCNGTGEQSCPNCNGSGTKTIAAYGLYGSTEMTSPDLFCGGTGKITCLECGGTGRKP